MILKTGHSMTGSPVRSAPAATSPLPCRGVGASLGDGSHVPSFHTVGPRWIAKLVQRTTITMVCR